MTVYANASSVKPLPVLVEPGDGARIRNWMRFHRRGAPQASIKVKNPEKFLNSYRRRMSRVVDFVISPP